MFAQRRVSFLVLFYFLFCIVSCANKDINCRTNCDCSDEMYDCSNKNLTKMINKTGDDIRTLDLSCNKINETTVLDAEFLTYLSLANNSLVTLKYDTFDNLDELKTLILSNNSIRRITDDVFEWNPLKLEVLYLDNNRLEFIQHFLLYDLEELTELHLQNNLITFIHSHAFNQLTKLRTVRLDGNHLHMFDRKWFRGLKANMFEDLRLYNNPWSCDCDMAPNAKWLKKTENKWFKRLLKHNDLVCKMPEDKLDKNVRDMGEHSKSEPRCDKPDIVGISMNTSLFVNQSIQLDCVVKKDTLPVPQLMWIAPNADHYNLQTADRFDGIEVFQNGSLIIHRVQTNDSGVYTCVATAHNISEQAVMKLNITEDKSKTPKFIDVEKATEFHEETHHHGACPEKCTCVALHVDCSSDSGLGEFAKIPNDVPLDARSLNMDSNKITTIPVFKEKMPHLTELRLDDNLIDTIENKAFDNLVELTTLTMRNNKLTKIPSRLFKKLSKLTILVLDNNELTSIDDHTFYNLKALQWLYIRHNLIASVSINAFTTLNNIKFIHMEYNKLTNLQPDTVTSLTTKRPLNLQKIFVDENMFSCDCRMEAMRLYLWSWKNKSQNQWESLFGDGIKCDFPVKLHDQFVTDIDEPFTCNFSHIPEIYVVGGNADGQKCHFPFEFQNKVYEKCIRIDDAPFNGKVWCATTESFSRDAKWGQCKTNDYALVIMKKDNPSGAFSGLWFAGLIFGFIVCIVGFVVYKRCWSKTKLRSMKYSNIPGYDDLDEHRTLTNGGSNGTEAFV